MSLPLLVAAGEQYEERSPASGEVHTVTRPEVKPKLGYVAIHTSPVPEVASLKGNNPRGDPPLRGSIGQSVEPTAEVLRLKDRVLARLVSDRIHASERPTQRLSSLVPTEASS